jgi:hypothetical protein
MAEEEHEFKAEYFLPRRVTLYVDHPSSKSNAELIQNLRASVAVWGGDNVRFPDTPRIVGFQRPEGSRSLSVVTADVAPGAVAQTVSEVFERFSALSANGDVPLPIFDIGNPEKEVRLNGISPTWLLGTGSHGIGHSGPGGKPSQADPPGTDAQWRFRFTDPNAADSETPDLAEHGGKGTTVILLDTVPREETLNDARENPAFQNHPLVNSLLRGPESDWLDIRRDWQGELEVLNYGAGREAYDMSDHGLFAAGIIRTIAPKAKLRLFEVMNHYGVGSIETIAAGLLTAYAMQRAQGDNPPAMLINASLMLGVPHGGHNHDNFPARLLDPLVWAFMLRQFGDLVALVQSAGIDILAAAGNDSKGRPRQAVRFPAAFDGVISVGAVARPASTGNTRAADYSNQSARPSRHPGELDRDGLVTLGGEEGLERGVRGIFVGGIPRPLPDDDHEHGHGGGHDHDHAPEDLPADGDHPIGRYPPHQDQHEYDACSTGWAWWSGTSFATPILTGQLARLRGEGGPLHDQGVESAQRLRNRTSTVVPGSNPAEHVVAVEQVV